MPVRGVIFDLDGTLVDSRLDFDAMRREMEFSRGQPILETIASLADESDRERCLEILHEHERRGAQAATLMPGARELLDELSARGLPQAILTRNSRTMTDLALSRLALSFSQVLTREDAPPKPHPGGLHMICNQWEFSPTEVLFVGDFHFDLIAGRAAGIRTVLYAPDELPDYAHEADELARSLIEILQFVDRGV